MKTFHQRMQMIYQKNFPFKFIPAANITTNVIKRNNLGNSLNTIQKYQTRPYSYSMNHNKRPVYQK